MSAPNRSTCPTSNVRIPSSLIANSHGGLAAGGLNACRTGFRTVRPCGRVAVTRLDGAAFRRATCGLSRTDVCSELGTLARGMTRGRYAAGAQRRVRRKKCSVDTSDATNLRRRVADQRRRSTLMTLAPVFPYRREAPCVAPSRFANIQRRPHPRTRPTSAHRPSQPRFVSAGHITSNTRGPYTLVAPRVRSYVIRNNLSAIRRMAAPLLLLRGFFVLAGYEDAPPDALHGATDIGAPFRRDRTPWGATKLASRSMLVGAWWDIAARIASHPAR